MHSRLRYAAFLVTFVGAIVPSLTAVANAQALMRLIMAAERGISGRAALRGAAYEGSASLGQTERIMEAMNKISAAEQKTTAWSMSAGTAGMATGFFSPSAVSPLRASIPRGQVAAEDVRTMCDPDSGSFQRDEASTRISVAITLNARKLGSNDAADRSQDMIESILKNCERILRDEIVNLPGYIYVGTRRDVIDERKARLAASAIAVAIHAPLSAHPAGEKQIEDRNSLQALAAMLTTRQSQVLAGLAQDKSTREIAGELGISEDRVREIRADIKVKYGKLGGSE